VADVAANDVEVAVVADHVRVGRPWVVELLYRVAAAPPAALLLLEAFRLAGVLNLQAVELVRDEAGGAVIVSVKH
jgi:hypothetical protein